MHHVLVIRLLAALCLLRPAGYNVAKVNVDAWSARLCLRDPMVPVLLGVAFHDQKRAVAHWKITNWGGGIDAVVPGAWPHVSHAPHLEERLGTERQRRDGRCRTQERATVRMPRDLVGAVKVEPEQHGVGGRAGIRGDLVDQWLQPCRYWLVGSEHRIPAIERRPTRRLAVVAESSTLVLHAEPRDILHDRVPPALGLRRRQPLLVVGKV
mmetsp:Transcript_88643/g.253339  ORF Transcript_88643/g.253339 Transcript_88643/m.253339 type:complete len:210 (-) Transcript_88643:236-865(-)